MAASPPATTPAGVAAAAVVRPFLDAIVEAAAGKKHTELRHEARSLLLRLEDVLSGEGGGGGWPEAAGVGAGGASSDGGAPPDADAAPSAAPASPRPRLTSAFGEEDADLTITTGGSGHRLEVVSPAAVAAADDEDDGGGGEGGGEAPGADPASPGAAALPPPQPYTGTLPAAGATELLRVLWLALDARRAALAGPALDAAARLVAGGFVAGTVHAPARGPPPPPPPPPPPGGDPMLAAAAVVAAGPPPPPPQALAVGLLCAAADPATCGAASGEPPLADDGVDLRILRGVLTAATAPGIHLHGGGLLLALRAAYTVFLGARTEATRVTARAALTQIVASTFARLEAAAGVASGGGGVNGCGPAALPAGLAAPPLEAEGSSAVAAAASAAHAAAASFVADVLSAVGVGGGGASSTSSKPDDLVAPGGGVAGPAIARALDAAFTAPGGGGRRAASQGEGRSGGPGAPPAGQPASPRSDPPSLCISPMASASLTAAAWPEEEPDPAAAAATARRDAFLVFRALCKLGARPGGGDGGGGGSSAAAAEAAAARGRVLALELLHGVLEGAGRAFAADARLAAAARQYLCLTLLKNARSPHAPAGRAAAAVFTAALVRLRAGLKAEVGVFYPMLLLAPLEPVGSVLPGRGGGAATGGPPAAPGGGPAPPTPVSAPPADPAARAAALRCLARVCADAPLLVDLFVNYDCDLEGAALFERTVLALVRTARGGGAAGGSGDDFNPAPGSGGPLLLPLPPPPPASPGEAAARAAALACLVTALRSLVAWVEGGGPAGPGGAGAAAGAAATQRLGAAALAAGVGADAASAAWAAGRADWAALASTSRTTNRPAVAAEGEDAPPTTTITPASPPALPRSPSSASTTTTTDGASVAALAQRRAYKRDFAAALATFNAHPRKGVAALQAAGILAADDPAAVAAFLASTPGLDKAAVGEYLGERDPGALAAMHAYVDALDFTGSTFDAALRSFLAGFRLPGEAQKIDRLVEKFAARFVACNPGAFGSADTAYVLAYSVVMLNTDAHNPQVKVKMSRADFIRNNRGINEGGDLPEAYLSAIYEAITTDEIRMKDEDGGGAAASAAASTTASTSSWMDTILNLFPGGGGGAGSAASGRARAAPSLADAAAIRRTHDLLRSAARGAPGFVAPPDAAAARPMVEAVWLPVLGALAAGFEGADASAPACLAGLVAAGRLAFLLGAPPGGCAAVARSLAALTSLHAPDRMGLKHAQAMRATLVLADECGDALGPAGWDAVLRAASRWDLVVNGGAGEGGGGGGDGASVGSSADTLSTTTSRRGLFGRSTTPTAAAVAAAAAAGPAVTSVLDAPLLTIGGGGGGGPRATGDGASSSGLPALPPPAILAELDSQELDRLFVGSDRLSSEAVVDFVVALLAVAREEVGLGGGLTTAPATASSSSPPPPLYRLFALDKVVTVAHFNMGCRIRLVWGRVWVQLADFFTAAGTHRACPPPVALHAVDALRQLAIKFLARPELAAFSFQADFLRPFVSIVRGSRDARVRELVVACAAQLAAARAPQIKSGWKAMFSVFTAAAGDADPAAVRAGFAAVERVVRDHFGAIAGAEGGAFQDCVNCLVAYANAAPAPLAGGGGGAPSFSSTSTPDVPLQAIAFLRFCAAALAEEGGSVARASGAGDGTAGAAPPPPMHPDALRIRPAGVSVDLDGGAGAGSAAAAAEPAPPGRGGQPAPSPEDDAAGRLLYLWFPLLAGLAELTFDPRPDTRAAAAEVLFDALACHGASFSPGAWARIFGSVLLPVFDHVRAGVGGGGTGAEGEYTTFAAAAPAPPADTSATPASEGTPAAAPPPPAPSPPDPDAWLYEAATRCLGRTIDVAAAFYSSAGPAALPGLIDLTASLIRRPHAPLAAVGVAAWARLVGAVGGVMGEAEWGAAAGALEAAARETAPGLGALVAWRTGGEVVPRGTTTRATPSLATGSGARRLAEARARAGTQALLVQAAAGALAQFSGRGGGGAAAAAALPPSAAATLLDALSGIAARAAAVDGDRALRTALAASQEADGVPAARRLPDPPLLGLEAEAGAALLATGERWCGGAGTATAGEALVVSAASRALEAVELAGVEAPAGSGEGAAAAEAAARAPLAAAALRSLRTAPPALSRRLLARLFPRVTAVLAVPHAPPSVLMEVAALLAERVAPLLAADEERGRVFDEGEG